MNSGQKGREEGIERGLEGITTYRSWGMVFVNHCYGDVCDVELVEMLLMFDSS